MRTPPTTMMTSNPTPCPIMGCKHSATGTSHPFQTLTTLIRHLQGDSHKHSLHLLDHSVCHDINLFTCSHHNCSQHPGHFFTSKRALDTHTTTHHPVLFTHHPSTPTTTFTNIIFDSHASTHLIDNWTNGINFILTHYDHEPPHFRSTLLHCLTRNNKKRFQVLHAKIIETIHSHSANASAPFWWLLFHIELLILCPTNIHNRDNTTISGIIHQQLDDLQSGNIEALFIDAFKIRSRNTQLTPPHNNGNRAAQIAADSDNYRTAIARLNSSNPIATITRNNISTVKALYSQPTPHRHFNPPPSTASSYPPRRHLPHHQTRPQTQRHRTQCRLHRHLHFPCEPGQPTHQHQYPQPIQPHLLQPNPNHHQEILHRHLPILLTQGQQRPIQTTTHRHPNRHPATHRITHCGHHERQVCHPPPSS